MDQEKDRENWQKAIEHRTGLIERIHKFGISKKGLERKKVVRLESLLKFLEEHWKKEKMR